MQDRIPLDIIAFFLLLSALSLIPYLVYVSRGRFGHKLDVSSSGFLALSGGIFVITTLFVCFLGAANFILAFALAVGVAFSVLHPVPAICFFVSLLFLRPWEFLQDNLLLKALPRLMAALTTCSWVVGMLRSGRNTIVIGHSYILFILLLCWICTSTLFSITPGASLRSFFESFSPTSVLVFLLLNSLITPNDLRAFLQTFIIAALGIVCVAFYITFRDYMSGASDFRLHSSGLWGNANDIAALAVLMLPLSLSSLTNRHTGQWHYLAPVPTLLFLAALLWSQSRAAQGSALLAGGVYLIFCSNNKRFVFIIVSIVVGLAAVVAAAMPQRDLADTSGSSESRYNYVIAGLRMARARPLFGVGVGNYPYLYEQYTPELIEYGNRTAHSTWVLALSETGIGGLLLLWALYGSVGVQAWKLRRVAPYYILSMITYGVAMSFLSHTYLFLPYVFMAFIMAYARSYRKGAHVLRSSTLRPQQVPQVASRAISRQHVLGILALFVLLPITNGAAEELIALGAQAGLNKPAGRFQPQLASAISLRGSRNETLTFMIKAEGSGCFPMSVIKEPTTSSPRPLEISFFALPEVTTAHPSFSGAAVGQYLDPVVPLPSDSRLCLEARNKESWFLGEVRIPKGHPIGLFPLKIRVAQQTIDIALTVWPMTIPDEPALPAYSELTPWFLVLGHYGEWHENEAGLAKLYTAAMLEHRIIPLKSIIARPQEEGPLSQRSLNLTELPSSRSSFTTVVLGNRPSWAYYDFPTVGANGTTAINFAKAESYFSAIQNSIPALHREGRALVYLWDEPKKAAFKELLKLSKLVKERAPSLKQLVTTTYSPQLEHSVDIFAPVMDQFDSQGFPAPSDYRNLQAKGHEVWWYVSCMSHGCDALGDSGVPDMVIDRPSSYIRSIGWLSMRYSIDAFLYYSMNNGFQFSPKRDPWKSLWDFSGNGDGTLFYPGRPGQHGLTTHQPLSSLRLKLWRESSYDAEYITWMNGLRSAPSWWSTESAQIARTTTAWNREYIRYQNLRDKAGDYLASQVGSEK